MSVREFREIVVQRFPEAAEDWDTILTFDFLPIGGEIVLQDDVQVMGVCPVIDRSVPTKAEIVESIALETDLNKSDVTRVLDALASQVKIAVCIDGPGKITISNLLTIEVDRSLHPAFVNARALKPLQDTAGKFSDELSTDA